MAFNLFISLANMFHRSIFCKKKVNNDRHACLLCGPFKYSCKKDHACACDLRQSIRASTNLSRRRCQGGKMNFAALTSGCVNVRLERQKFRSSVWGIPEFIPRRVQAPSTPLTHGLVIVPGRGSESERGSLHSPSRVLIRTINQDDYLRSTFLSVLPVRGDSQSVTWCFGQGL